MSHGFKHEVLLYKLISPFNIHSKYVTLVYFIKNLA